MEDDVRPQKGLLKVLELDWSGLSFTESTCDRGSS